MLRLITYVSLSIIFIIASSCSELHKETKKETDTYSYKQSNQISSIDKREINLLIRLNENVDTSFIYSANITVDVGKNVNKSINEIVLLKADVPRKNYPFSVTFINDDQYIENYPTILRLVFDNDIFNNTDYYYTNGVVIELINPIAKRLPLTRMLVGLSDSQVNLYGFSVKQNIYTPTNPDIEEISMNDRPFSAFLTIGHFRESYNLKRNISIKSSLNFGVLGPASMGGIVQSSIHNIEPVGWDNQIKNSVVIDYALLISKGMISTPHFELNVTAGGNIGTIFNKLNSGLYIRTGSFIPVFRGLATNIVSTSISKTEKSTFQYWFFLSAETNLVFYDATLQGGIFNAKDPYTIPNNDINRLVATISVGLAAYYKNIGIELQNYYLTPEFKNAYDFRWGRIKFIYQF